MRLAFHRQLRGELRCLRDTAPEVLTFEPGGSLVRLMGINMMRYQDIDVVEELAFDQACARLRGSALPQLLNAPVGLSA